MHSAMLHILALMFRICCHQELMRSPVYLNIVFPLCFRCAGLFFGIFSSYLVLISGKFSPSVFRSKDLFVLALFFLPLMVDGMADRFSIWQSPGAVRGITGLLTGIP